MTERRVGETGSAETALRGATTAVRATYRWPFQLHASIGAVVRGGGRHDGRATVWSATQGAHQLCAPIAALSGIPDDSVRVIFTEAQGATATTGRTTSRATPHCCRKPWESRCACSGVARTRTRWEPEGPAMLFEMAGAVARTGRSPPGRTMGGRRRMAAVRREIRRRSSPECWWRARQRRASSSAAVVNATRARHTCCLTNA